RALGPTTPVTAAVLSKDSATIFDVANHEFNRSTVGAIGPVRSYDADILSQVASESGFRDARASISNAKSPASFETSTGFAINGARVRAAMAVGDTRAQVLSGHTEPALVTIYPGRRPATVGLMFEDGSGTIVAALPGVIGTLTVERGGVTNVSYVPSFLQQEYEYAAQKARRNEVQARLGAGAEYGAFRIEGTEEERYRTAIRIADQIRVLKWIDVTLGIYAAYAFADSNLPEQVRSVRAFL